MSRVNKAVWQSRWRAKQRSLGLCTRCAQPVVPGMTLCVRHHVGKLMRQGKGSSKSSAWTRYLLSIKEGKPAVSAGRGAAAVCLACSSSAALPSPHQT